MYIYSLLIICVVPLCFCEELRNQNDEESRRVKRTPEKIVEDINKIIKDNNKIHISLLPKIKATIPLPLKSKERQQLVQKPKDGTTLSSQPKVNRVSPLNHPLRPIVQTQPKNVVKARRPESSLHKNNFQKQNTISVPGGNQNKEQLKTKKTDKLQKEITPEPIHLIEDPVEDIKITTKPRATTPSQNIESQIEKPIVEHKVKSNDKSDDSDKRTYSHLEDFSPKISTRNATSISADDKNLDDAKRIFRELDSLHESDARRDKIKGKPNPTKASNEIHNQLEVPEIHNVETNILKLEEKIAEKRTKAEAASMRNREDKDLNDTGIKEMMIPKRKVMNLVPLPVPSNIVNTPLSDKSLDNTENLIISRSAVEEINNTTSESDDVYHLAQPLVNSFKNKSIEVIEIKQRNFTEVVEKQPPSNDSNEPSLSWQGYTQTPKDNQDSYKPDVSLIPPSYGYPYSNQNINNCYYKTNPYNNNFQRKFENPLQKTWRSWVNTEVVIKLNNPHNIEIQPVITTKMPSKTNYDVNIRRDANPSYTSYPCYVYPSICYGTNNGYYQ